MEFIDYYAELGVPRTATQDEISRAFKKLARKYHPDVNKEPGAEAKFRRINEAGEVLKDPDKRKKYDQFGAAWKNAERAAPNGGAPGQPPPGFEDLLNRVRRERAARQQQPPPGFGGFEGSPSGFSDFFEAIFGRGRNPFSGFSQEEADLPGQHVEATLELSLEEAARGGGREISLSDAGGKTRSFEVRIPKGVKPGQKIRLKGQGAPARRGGPAGDLLLVIAHRPDPRFRLEGNDLYTELPVSPWIAALGGQAKLRTLDGQVTVSVPAGSSTGRKIRLRGKGFPTTDGAGDLYAEVKIVIPKKLSQKEKDLFTALAEASEFDPSA